MLEGPLGTSVAAGAVVWTLVCALVAGVVTEVTLSPHGVTALLTADAADAIVIEPAGRCSVTRPDLYPSILCFSTQFPGK